MGITVLILAPRRAEAFGECIGITDYDLRRICQRQQDQLDEMQREIDRQEMESLLQTPPRNQPSAPIPAPAYRPPAPIQAPSSEPNSGGHEEPPWLRIWNAIPAWIRVVGLLIAGGVAWDYMDEKLRTS